jgi:hypothetical protein
MMGAAVQQVVEVEPIFEDAGQAVHVAFLVMAQPARQDAPFRKALIRSMESIKLNTSQRHWLDQLRGESSGKVNFAGLDMNEVRAQCVMIKQAVATKLPDPERWVLLAKYGEIEFEDVVDEEPGSNQVAAALDRATNSVRSALERDQKARYELEATREHFLSVQNRIMPPGVLQSAQEQYQAARDAVRDAGLALAKAQSHERAARIALEKLSSCRIVNSGPRVMGRKGESGKAEEPRRRYAFPAERIAAIDGLAQWFAPMFPRIKPLAICCMLGRMFAKHKKIDISARDLERQFGGSDTTYLRASWKMKNHLRQLEGNAIARLAPYLADHGVVAPVQEIR